MKLDLTVQNDFYRIYDDPTVRFEPKSNPTVRNKSQRFFDNPMAILTPKNSINTPKIIHFHYKLIRPHLSSISLSNNFFFVLYPNFLEDLCELRYVTLFINFVFMHILFSFILVLK